MRQQFREFWQAMRRDIGKLKIGWQIVVWPVVICSVTINMIARLSCLPFLALFCFVCDWCERWSGPKMPRWVRRFFLKDPTHPHE